MIGTILNAILGTGAEKKDEQGGGLGSLLIIGAILFVLLGGLKLFQKADEAENPLETQLD